MMIASAAFATRKKSTPSIVTGTLSRVITCCLGMFTASTRVSTIRIWSISGITMNRPGPLMVWNLPSRKTTAFSHCAASRIDDETTTSRNSQPMREEERQRRAGLADGDRRRPLPGGAARRTRDPRCS